MEKRRRDPGVPKTANRRIAVGVFFASLAILGLLLVVLIHFHSNLRKQELRYLAVNTANKVTKAITDRIWKAGTLATLIEQGGGTMDDFDKIAAILVNDHAILNVTLAPNGVVTRIFPVPGNESVFGLDYLSSGGRNEARSAIEAEQLTLAGPFALVQGGEGLTGRLPVFLRRSDGSGKTFWGFVGIALRYPEVLDSAYLDELYQQGFVGQIWRIHPENGQKQVIWQSGDEPIRNPETSDISLFNVTWHISVARLPDFLSFLAPFGYALGIVLFSLLLAVLVFHYLELHNVKSALESMALTDALTGLPNRRAVIDKLSETIALARAAKRSFVIVYIDLDGFKQVNDTFGHDAGDRVLVETAVALRDCIADNGMVARVGGDEFIVLLPGYREGGELDRLLECIGRRLTRTVHDDSAEMPGGVAIGASVGQAVFPADGTELSVLLHCADVRMFDAKKKSKPEIREFVSHFR